jgi:hypothetical protein
MLHEAQSSSLAQLQHPLANITTGSTSNKELLQLLWTALLISSQPAHLPHAA